MRIAIFGQAKSGTSALFAKLQDALPANTDCYFEPHAREVRRYRQRHLLELLRLRRSRPLLAKFLPFHADDGCHVAAFGSFDHAIQLVRDPRDRLISELLYWSFNTSLPRDSAAAAAFIARIEAKEQVPQAVSTIDLLTTFHRQQDPDFAFARWLADFVQRAVDAPLAFAAVRPELIEFRYEAMVAGEFGPVAEATGLALRGEAEVGPQLQRVVRRKGYGDWRNWFTEADVACFQPALQPYLDRFYPQADWQLSAAPVIDPAHGSGYVRRIVNEARGLTRLAPLPEVQG